MLRLQNFNESLGNINTIVNDVIQHANRATVLSQIELDEKLNIIKAYVVNYQNPSRIIINWPIHITIDNDLYIGILIIFMYIIYNNLSLKGILTEQDPIKIFDLIMSAGGLYSLKLLQRSQRKGYIDDLKE